MARPAIYDLGIFPRLTLTSEQVLSLDDDGVTELRDLGTTSEMLAQLFTEAAQPGCRFELDFAAQTIIARV
jgi:hypothetical protein